MKTVRDFVDGLTGVLVSVIGLGIVAGIVFGGNAWFVGDVIGTIMGYVDMLGAGGLGGYQHRYRLLRTLHLHFIKTNFYAA